LLQWQHMKPMAAKMSIRKPSWMTMFQRGAEP
jgi:hypothetical protein